MTSYDQIQIHYPSMPMQYVKLDWSYYFGWKIFIKDPSIFDNHNHVKNIAPQP